MSLADILEEAASALPGDADAIRPANGDPFQLLDSLDAAAAGRVLAWVLERDAEAGTELALSWGEDDRGPDLLAALDEKSLPKSGRKGLRRARHRLRSQGVAIPEQSRTGVVGRLPEIADEIAAGYVSAVDPRGARLVYLVLANPSGGARLFEIMLDEDRGIVDFELYAAGRSRIRKFVRDAVDRARFPAVEAEPDAVRALVHRIAARHPASRALPRQFGEWRAEVAVQGATPGDQVAEALAIDDPQAGVARAADLVRKGVVGPWGPSPTELANLVQERLEEHAKQAADEEADAAFFREAAGTIASAATPEIQAERFRESAYVLWKLGEADDARACLCAAAAFSASEPGDSSVGDAVASVTSAVAPVTIAVAETLLAGALDGLRERGAKAPSDGSEA